MPRSAASRVCLLLIALAAAGCAQGVPPGALALEPQSLERRQMQTRRYQTTDEAAILQASAGLLQDTGFMIDASRSSLGLLCGSKDRDATDGGQVAASIAIALLGGAPPPVDENQRIRISIVSFPSGNEVAVRVTFQRIVWDTSGHVSRLEFLDTPKLYEEFFDRLSKAIFLEGQKI